MTWLLWFGPAIVFAFGLVYVVRFMKSQASKKQVESLSDEDMQRIKNLHAEQGDK
jgi:cytochrome c-type biogenesis protein CcmH/NrfF